MDFEFVECYSCRAKPGMPTLCDSCLANREAIEHWKALALTPGDKHERFLKDLSASWRAEEAKKPL